jgi:hypothetical protein
MAIDKIKASEYDVKSGEFIERDLSAAEIAERNEEAATIAQAITDEKTLLDNKQRIKESALAKLAALGLTMQEIAAITS